jgi:hypothetical protein
MARDLDMIFALMRQNVRLEDQADVAWGIIANVSGGEREKQSKQWQKAAKEWARNHPLPPRER